MELRATALEAGTILPLGSAEIDERRRLSAAASELNIFADASAFSAFFETGLGATFLRRLPARMASRRLLELEGALDGALALLLLLLLLRARVAVVVLVLVDAVVATNGLSSNKSKPMASSSSSS